MVERPFLRLSFRNLSTIALVVAGMLAPLSGAMAEGPVVITLWDHHVHDKKFRQQIFKEFNKANPDIKVEYTSQVGDAMKTILDASFRSGTPPDIFVPVIPGGLAKAVDLGWVMPLDDVAPSRDALQKWMARFPQDKQPFVEDTNVFRGKVYSWPISAEGGYMMIFWNPLLFREAGLKGIGGKSAVPETWEDTRTFAKKITELGQGKVYGIVHGIKFGHWGPDITWSLAVSAGWSLYGSTRGFDLRTGRYDYHNPAYTGPVQLWLDMKKDGSVFPGDLSMDEEQARFKFSLNLAGITFDGYWLPGGLLALNPDLEFDTALPPTPERGKRLGGLGTGPVAGSSEYAVSSKVKSREAAWRVIQFMTSKEYQEGWVKAGGGFSVFSEYNKREFFPHPTLAKIADMGKDRPVWPVLPPGANRVFEIVGTEYEGHPDGDEIITGMWVGKVGWEAYDDLEKKLNDGFDKALTDAKKEGINLTRADFIIPDWDPAKSYTGKKK